jgi:peptide-N4-(N-acetyl-beta-glucosaminyl)asparagine amidase
VDQKVTLYDRVYTRSICSTIIFCSPNEPHRKAIRNSIRDSGMLDKYTGLALRHLPRAPDYNQLIQLASDSGLQGMDEHESHVVSPFGYPVFSTSARLQMGQSLCVSSSNYRKATAGVTIHISGIDCVLTAVHAFHDALVHSESDHLEEDLCFSDSDDGNSLSTPSYNSDVHTSRDAHCDPSPRSSWSSSVTLPPISDCAALHLETESSNMQERRDTNIQLCDRSQTVEPPVNAYHTGDALFLSSQGMHEELDYAIIRPRSETKSISKDDDITFPSFVKLNKENELATAYVDAYISPSPTVTHGTISSTPTYMRAPEGKAYEEVYPVKLEKPLANGDCGSWVFDGQSQSLLGHIDFSRCYY